MFETVSSSNLLKCVQNTLQLFRRVQSVQTRQLQWNIFVPAVPVMQVQHTFVVAPPICGSGIILRIQRVCLWEAVHIFDTVVVVVIAITATITITHTAAAQSALKKTA